MIPHDFKVQCEVNLDHLQLLSHSHNFLYHRSRPASYSVKVAPSQVCTYNVCIWYIVLVLESC